MRDFFVDVFLQWPMILAAITTVAVIAYCHSPLCKPQMRRLPEEEHRYQTQRQTDALEQMARVQYDTLVNNHTFKNPNKRN